MCNIKFVCHVNKQESLRYSFSQNIAYNIVLLFTQSLMLEKNFRGGGGGRRQQMIVFKSHCPR